jgi:hypothetical protein
MEDLREQARPTHTEGFLVRGKDGLSHMAEKPGCRQPRSLRASSSGGRGAPEPGEAVLDQAAP